MTRRSGALATAALCLAVLTGCAAGPPDTPSASATASLPAPSPSGTASASATAAPALVLRPDGSASDNLAYFTSIVAAVWAGPDRASGRAYIDALATAGFDKGAMQVTNDESTVGNPAESIQFSVLWAGECLVGQVGPATGEPVTTVLPVVGEGSCLIGQTRPIDW
ncbi:hypothetical protein G5T42_14425 [Microbacterium sp. 4R-513]|nr:hypothetical protein G5T42_14425 [Microbacterium sp. 4R-513]